MADFEFERLADEMMGRWREEAPLVDAEAFRRLVESRRSVRKFKPEAIPDQTMRECFRLALLAPNSSNLQPWELHWVRSPEKKAKLVNYCFGQSAARTAPELVVAVARTKTWRAHARQMVEIFDHTSPKPPKMAYDYYRRLVPFAYGVGPWGLFAPFKMALVWLVGWFRPVPREPATPNDVKIWAVKTTALACENFMLALRAHGYDSCPMEGLDSKRVAQLLGLPGDALVVMAFGCGLREPEGVYGPQIRFPLQQFVREH